MDRIATLLVTLGLLLSTAAQAADIGDPCKTFAWPLTNEQTLLAGAAQTPVATGGRIDRAAPVAFRLTLSPDAAVAFALPPQKPPMSGGLGGVVGLPAPAADGDYFVTLSSEGWIDVLQNGAAIASTAHSGAKNCPGMRKSVEFHFAAGAPLTLQLSSVPGPTIDVAVTQAGTSN